MRQINKHNNMPFYKQSNNIISVITINNEMIKIYTNYLIFLMRLSNKIINTTTKNYKYLKQTS